MLGGRLSRSICSVAAAGVKKALAPWSEVIALDRVEAAWRSLEEHLALNASIERVFRDSRGRFKSGPAHIITAEMAAGLNPPEFKTKVATALDMKRCWKEHPDLVYSVAREAAEARLLSRPISSAAFSLVRKVLSREWAVPRRENVQ